MARLLFQAFNFFFFSFLLHFLSKHFYRHEIHLKNELKIATEGEVKKLLSENLKITLVSKKIDRVSPYYCVCVCVCAYRAL